MLMTMTFGGAAHFELIFHKSTVKKVTEFTAQFPFNLFQIQIFGYNSQLYTNFTDAVYRAQGIVAVSVLLQVNTHPASPTTSIQCCKHFTKLN